MQKKQQDRRINGAALENIMQDVLTGMQDFTLDACCGCNAASLEILSVEPTGKPATRPVAALRFPSRRIGTRRG